MKRTISLLAILTALFTIASCGDSGETFQLSGTLANGANKTIWIEEISPREVIFIDSVKLDSKGHFSYRYSLPYESIYTIHTSPSDYIMFIPQGGDNITISGDFDRFSWTYDIKGSHESTLLWQLQSFTNETNLQINELVTSLEQLDHQLATNEISQSQYDLQKKEFDSIYLECYGVQQDYVIKMIQDNPGSLAAIIAVHKPFNNQHPLIDPQFNTDYYELVLEGLEERIPDNPHTQHFYNEVARYQSLYKRSDESIVLD